MINNLFTCFPKFLLFFLFINSSILFANEFADKQPLAKHSLLLDIAKSEGLIVAVGQRGHILYSTNNEDWNQANVPVRHLLTAVYLQDDQVGFAVGHHGVILKTIDGAKTWRSVAYAEDEAPLLDIIFINSTTGFAIGAYGAFYTTHDAGESWQKNDINISDEFDYHLNAIASADKNRFFIVGESGLILRSDNAGKTWEILPSPYHGSLFGLLSLSYDELIVFGLKGKLFHSKDAGKTWIKLDVEANALLTHAAKLQDNTIVVTGMAGTILVKHNIENAFRTYTLPESDGIASLIEMNNQLILVGEKGLRILDKQQLGF